MNTDHVEVGPGFSDAEVAEIFMHHRVLVVPVVADGHVEAMIRQAGSDLDVATDRKGRPYTLCLHQEPGEL